MKLRQGEKNREGESGLRGSIPQVPRANIVASSAVCIN